MGRTVLAEVSADTAVGKKIVDLVLVNPASAVPG